MNNIDDNNNNYINNNDDINIKEDFQEIVKRKIGRPPFIKTDKTIFKKINYNLNKGLWNIIFKEIYSYTLLYYYYYYYYYYYFILF